MISWRSCISLAATYDKAGVNAIVSVILDGENCWEYYPNDGGDFLRALYGRLEKDKQIETVLPSQVFAGTEPIKALPFLFSGSWINHNFRVWIGHEEDNAAWDLLSTTRDQLVEFLGTHPDFDKDKTALAWKEIYIAEGSDWCWWYGEDHQTEFFELFDYLFRKQLQNVWELIGIEPPALLMSPIRKLARLVGLQEPTDFVTPVVDGRQTDFFEWFGAGRVECHKMGGAMHRADAKIHEILFGYDDNHVYFRIDFEKEALFDRDKAKLLIDLVCEDKHSGRDYIGRGGVEESRPKRGTSWSRWLSILPGRRSSRSLSPATPRNVSAKSASILRLRSKKMRKLLKDGRKPIIYSWIYPIVAKRFSGKCEQGDRS